MKMNLELDHRAHLLVDVLCIDGRPLLSEEPTFLEKELVIAQSMAFFQELVKINQFCIEDVVKLLCTMNTSPRITALVALKVCEVLLDEHPTMSNFYQKIVADIGGRPISKYVEAMMEQNRAHEFTQMQALPEVYFDVWGLVLFFCIMITKPKKIDLVWNPTDKLNVNMN